MKLNGTVELLKRDDGEIRTLLAERDADTEAQSIVRESQGKVKCLVVESKFLHVFNPTVDRIVLNVLEADQIKTTVLDLKSLSYEAGEQ